MIILLIVIIAVFLLWLGIGYYGFKVAIRKGKERDIYDRESLKGSSWDKYYDEIHEGIAWIKSHPCEEVQIQSEDGLKLKGRLILNPDAHGTVLMFHGYHTHPEIDFSASSHVYFESGNHILLIDQRSSGESEGKYIGFGVLESKDCKLWAEYVAERFGSDKKIILAGLSMGAATVLMATRFKLPGNVCGIVADSAFSSPREIIRRQIQHMYPVNGTVITMAIGVWSRVLAGYRLDEVSIPELMKHNRIPVFFIHGTEDDLVPIEMTMKAVENCAAPKQILYVEGAVHGTGYMIETDTYEKMLREFCS